MAQEFWDEKSQGQGMKKLNIFLQLNEKEQLKLLSLLEEADKHYEQYKKSLEKIVEFFKDLELKYSYLSEENPEYEGTYDEISKLVENLESLAYKISSPYEILNKAI